MFKKTDEQKFIAWIYLNLFNFKIINGSFDLKNIVLYFWRKNYCTYCHDETLDHGKLFHNLRDIMDYHIIKIEYSFNWWWFDQIV